MNLEPVTQEHLKPIIPKSALAKFVKKYPNGLDISALVASDEGARSAAWKEFLSTEAVRVSAGALLMLRNTCGCLRNPLFTGNMRGLSLQYFTMKEPIFMDAKIQDVSIYGIDMHDAVITKCIFPNAFLDVTLYSPVIADSTFDTKSIDLHLFDGSVTRVNFKPLPGSHSTVFSNNTKFVLSDLSDVYAVKMQGGFVTHCIVSTRINATGTEFRETEFMAPEWISSAPKLKKSTLLGCNFSNVRLRGARFDYAIARNCKFDGADLSGAVLVGADLRASSFVGANLAKAVWDADTQWPKGLFGR